jgi:hypothetical protein
MIFVGRPLVGGTACPTYAPRSQLTVVQATGAKVVSRGETKKEGLSPMDLHRSPALLASISRQG